MELKPNLKNAYTVAYKIDCDKLNNLDWDKVSLNTNFFFHIFRFLMIAEAISLVKYAQEGTRAL